MTTPLPAALDSATLALRLRDLVGDERRVQVEFLLHLDEFDRRQAFLQAGFGSLWDYCLKALHLREGAAGRRIGAMRVLRRFPRLEGPLRDGRLCLSTVSLLGQVLDDDNLEELVGRAAFLTKSEVEHLVVSLRPRNAPKDGIRQLVSTGAMAGPAFAPSELNASTPLATCSLPAAPDVQPKEQGKSGAEDVPIERQASTGEADGRGPRRAEVQAVSRDRWSLRVTLDAALKSDLESLKTLLSHKVPSGDLTEVLREAVRCAIEKHGKRRGTVAPEVHGKLGSAVAAQRRGTGTAEPTAHGGRSSRGIPAAVRRQVWDRDGGRCTFEGADGRRCESRWQLEFDHVDPASLGGASTAANLRIRCRKHNVLYAEEVYGREHMARFRRDSRRSPPTGEFTISGDSA